ncbi:hypothetical protein ACTU44_09730 [Thalassospira sp. SM2505]|uniref:Uncharacterized protein n=1 Tax=Thalassospira profundimaris TaxID=502049 RepID=A0A367WT82_9PROT|nr:hypothetical protein [Thalassospira profundimaris]RCK44597.1 hypothetical protein TH30_14590 [Thalassospira profundimaris]
MKFVSPLRLAFTAIGIGAIGLLWGSAAIVWLLLPGGSPNFLPPDSLFPALILSLVIFGGLGFGAAILTESWEDEARQRRHQIK